MKTNKRGGRKTGANAPEHLLGSTVLGERGQVVIPKEFRDSMQLKPGSRLVVMQHMGGPLVLFPADQMRDFVRSMSDRITAVLKK